MAKKDTIKTIVTLRMTLSQLNELHCYLNDARNWNEEHGYPKLAGAVTRIKNLLDDQVPRERVTAAFEPLMRQYITEKEEANVRTAVG